MFLHFAFKLHYPQGIGGKQDVLSWSTPAPIGSDLEHQVMQWSVKKANLIHSWECYGDISAGITVKCEIIGGVKRL